MDSMSEVFKDVKPEAHIAVLNEADEIRRLFELTEPKYNPWRADYDKICTDCYNFKELRQWDSPDIASLIPYDVPALAVDRINRVLDVVDGIRENTGNKIKVIKRAMGDEAVATILDKVREYVYYCGDFDMARDEAFAGLKDVGLGMRKIGYDPTANGGFGEIWCEAIQVEEVGWSYTRKKNFNDVRWYWEHHTMDWEDAAKLNPKMAGQIQTLKAVQVKKWDEMKGGAVKGQLGNDYQTARMDGEHSYSYPDQVHVWEIWVKRTIPYKIVASMEQPPLPPVDGQGGIAVDGAGQLTPNVPVAPAPPPIPKFKKVPHDYQEQEGEESVSAGVDTEWYQNIICTSKTKNGSILLTPSGGIKSEFDFDPYVAMVSQFKKSGAPRGLIEICIPHQMRANIGWAQKTAYGNKTIKAPLVTTGNALDIENAIQQTRLGAYLHLPTGTTLVQLNTNPNPNLQALEEIASAKEDMDFAAAASEPVLRGQAQASASGISIAKRQDAAVTSINKWVKAEKDAELVLGRKVLKMIIKKFTPEKLARIVGEQFFYQTLGYQMTPLGLLPTGIIDPVTGQKMGEAIPLPLTLDVEHYDVQIQDEALSDFNKQQSFNAAAELVQMGFGMDADYMISNAPIKNPEEALASHNRWKTDIVRQQQAVIEQLTQALGIVQKQQGSTSQPQRANARKGKAAPESGIRSMLGGAGPGSPVGNGGISNLGG
jgi:hypothetical protein